MKRVPYYEVILENRQTTRFTEIFGFKPSVTDIQCALETTALAMLQAADEETDPLDKDKLMDDAHEFDLLKQLIPVMTQADVDIAIEREQIDLGVAGTPVGLLGITTRSMLVQEQLDAQPAYPSPDCRVHPACTTVSGRPGPAQFGGNGV
jgi:hypothetical protein